MRLRRWPLLLAGMVVMAGVLGLIKGCASSPPVDLVGGGRAALDRTAGATADAADLEERVGRFVNLFNQFEPGSVAAAASELYAADAYFNDGFAELEGLEAIAAYLEHSASMATAVEVELEHWAVADGEVYVRWVMRFATRSTEIVAPGMSHLRLDAAGRIVYHHDYWDASAALAEFVPLVAPVLRAVRSRVVPESMRRSTSGAESSAGDLLANEEDEMIWSPENDPATWPSIDDRVMGGVSQSGMRATDGIAIFEGEVSKENNGGFASVRSLPANHDLSSFRGVVLKVRGDGKRYRFRLRTTDAFGGVSYQAPLEPGAGKWQEIEISFTAFEPVLRGRPVPGHPPLDPAEVKTLGFLIADGQEGGFRLEVAWIRGLV